MKKIAALSLILFFLPSFPEDNYECIGLGEVCTTASALQFFGLRNTAYPFDWTITSYESLCNVLENDFKDFLNPDYLYLREDGKGIINKYGIVFVHDFPTTHYEGDLQIESPLNEGILKQNWLNFLPEIQQKYTRRIERLNNVCNSDKKVYFIRHSGIRAKEEACLLRDILRKRYPILDFTLIVISHDISSQQPWQEENIKNYYVKPTSVWNDVAEWQKIFIDLNLISAAKSLNFDFDNIKQFFHNHY